MRVEVFNALFVPTGTPADVLATLKGAAARAKTEAGFLQDLEKAGAEPFAQGDEQKFIRDEVGRWRRIVAALGFKVE
jgi:tripartite-type tricarboxylate transporter receptor subunit TctC